MEKVYTYYASYLLLRIGQNDVLLEMLLLKLEYYYYFDKLF